MTTSPEEEFLNSKGVMEKISFTDGEPHTLTIEERKLDTFTDQAGEETDGVRYTVKEDGKEKSFFTTSIALIQKLKDVESGEEVTINQRKYKQGGIYKTTYEVEYSKTPKSGKESKEEFNEKEIADEDLPF